MEDNINEAVAKKLGYTRDPSSGWYSCNGSLRKEYCPRFCQDIEAAWEIVEFVKEKKWEINGMSGHELNIAIHNYPSNYPSFGPRCDIWNFGSSAPEPMVRVYADTPAMAICLAFLKLSDATPDPAKRTE